MSTENYLEIFNSYKGELPSLSFKREHWPKTLGQFKAKCEKDVLFYAYWFDKHKRYLQNLERKSFK